MEEYGPLVLTDCVVPVCSEAEHAHSADYIADHSQYRSKGAVHVNYALEGDAQGLRRFLHL